MELRRGDQTRGEETKPGPKFIDRARACKRMECKINRALRTHLRERARTIERLREDGEEFSEKGELLIARDREAERARKLLIVSKGKKGEFGEREERDFFLVFFGGEDSSFSAN